MAGRAATPVRVSGHTRVRRALATAWVQLRSVRVAVPSGLAPRLPVEAAITLTGSEFTRSW